MIALLIRGADSTTLSMTIAKKSPTCALVYLANVSLPLSRRVNWISGADVVWLKPMFAVSRSAPVMMVTYGLPVAGLTVGVTAPVAPTAADASSMIGLNKRARRYRVLTHLNELEQTRASQGRNGLIGVVDTWDFHDDAVIALALHLRFTHAKAVDTAFYHLLGGVHVVGRGVCARTRAEPAGLP